MMAFTPDPTASYTPNYGVLIPSPFPSHTHAIACHPFDPNVLLCVEGRLRYLREHAIKEFPLEEQAIHNAGQAIVVREMANVRRAEVQARRHQNCPEIKLAVHGNPNAKPLGDVAYWRKMLGWAGAEEEYSREQFHRYTTMLPGMNRLLKGVQDRSIWDHETGEWRATTSRGVQEAKNRRDWVCAELERIDALRYETMLDWKKKIDEGYMGSTICNKDNEKKRERDEENDVAIQTTSPTTQQGEMSNQEVEGINVFQRPTISIDTHVAKYPRLSIEGQFDFFPQFLPEPRAPDSQEKLSSASASPDGGYDIRSQAPEPESPIKFSLPSSTIQSTFPAPSTTEDSIRRYSFVLDIPTTDNQRVQWLKFLDKYEWNPAMISALRVFFCAEPTPNTSMTKKFLERLWEVCATIEEVVDEEHDNPDREYTHKKQYRLLWDRKVKGLSDEVSELATPIKEEDVSGNGKGNLLRDMPTQPTWLRTPSVSPLSSVNMPLSVPFGNAALPASPSDARVRALHSGESSDDDEGSVPHDGPNHEEDVGSSNKIDVPALMKAYVGTLKRGDRVVVPCDNCRSLNLDCRINSSSCRRCATRHDRCVWNDVEIDEAKALGLLGEGEGDDGDDVDDEKAVRKPTKKRGRSKMATRAKKVAVGAERSRRVREKSVYDLPEDGDDESSGHGAEEEEYVPSS